VRRVDFAVALIGEAPYVAVHLRSVHFGGLAWMLVDTGASRTTLLDRDVAFLSIPPAALEPTMLPIVGVGGSVRSLRAPRNCTRNGPP